MSSSNSKATILQEPQSPMIDSIENLISNSESKSIRIAFVSPYPPSKGTLNEYAFHLIEQMKEKKEIEEIIVITDKLPKGASYPDLGADSKVTIKDVWNFNSLKTSFDIRKAILECKADVVFYNIQFLSFGDKKIQATLGLLAPLMSKLSGVPSVVMLHNITETVDYESAGITSNPLLKKFYNFSGTILTKLLLSADMITVTIPKYVKILEEKYKVKNVALVPHGSFEVIPMPDFDTWTSRKQVMTFGKFGTYKKVEEMIEAVDLVRQRTNEPIDIVIAGTDNPNVKGYLEDVKDQYRHIEDIYFTGYVEEEDVPKIFSDSTLVVFPYTSTTGSSGVLHQAGCYAKAVVLPNIGDLKELIEEEGYEGEYFKPSDVASLADAIEKLIVDKDHRDALAVKNYAAASSLPMSDMVDWFLIHFNSLIKKVS